MTLPEQDRTRRELAQIEQRLQAFEIQYQLSSDEFHRRFQAGELGDLDAKVRQLIEAEHLRRLAQYRRADLALARKYGMTFDEFLTRRIPRQRDYSWEVEQDAMAWESAVGGMMTVERQLQELRGFNDLAPSSL